MITGHTRVLGLIGNPIEHTMSPFIHNMLAQACGIDMVYVPFKVEQGRLENAIQGVKALNLKGVNVTVPYKMDVMEWVDEVDEAARSIGAMNTVVVRENRLIGYNTDVLGLKRSLEKEDIFIKDQAVLIIGAGGAARAVAVMCANSEAKKIVIVNRTHKKAEALAKDIEMQFNIEVSALALGDMEKDNDNWHQVDLIFQTTSVGMSPNFDKNPMPSPIIFTGAKAAVDLIYNPTETQFLKLAKKSGLKIVNGLGMLYYQAVMAFELWNDIQIDQETIEACYKKFEKKVLNC